MIFNNSLRQSLGSNLRGNTVAIFVSCPFILFFFQRASPNQLCQGVDFASKTRLNNYININEVNDFLKATR